MLKRSSLFAALALSLAALGACNFYNEGTNGSPRPPEASPENAITAPTLTKDAALPAAPAPVANAGAGATGADVARAAEVQASPAVVQGHDQAGLEMARLGAERATAPALRALSSEIAQTYQQALSQTSSAASTSTSASASAASSSAATPQSQPDPRDASRVSRLQNLQGKDFDRVLIESLVNHIGQGFSLNPGTRSASNAAPTVQEAQLRRLEKMLHLGHKGPAAEGAGDPAEEREDAQKDEQKRQEQR